MDDQTVWMIVIIAVLVILSAYFSATETAFTSVNRIKIKNMAMDGDRRAERVLTLIGEYDKLLSTILIGNNIVNIGMTAIATMLFVELYGSRGASYATLVMTLVVLIFGEISPKSLAKESPESFSMFSAPLIRGFMWILTPVNYVFSLWKKLLSKVFLVSNTRNISEDELLTMVEEAETEGSLEQEQSELIQNAIEFNEVEAEEVMTPRVDIVAIDLSMTEEEIQDVFRTTGFSRLPVYEEDMDSVQGVLNEKDFHNYVLGSEHTVSDFVKPVVFVAGSMKISSLLRKLQSMQTHMAIIVDEYGGTEGLVTMEDIIEEIVGEINDEYDEDERSYTRLNQNTYVFEAKTLLSDFRKIMQLPEDAFDDVAGDADTLAGLLLEIKGEFPQEHERISHERFTFEVMEMDERRIVKIKVIVGKE